MSKIGTFYTSYGREPVPNVENSTLPKNALDVPLDEGQVTEFRVPDTQFVPSRAIQAELKFPRPTNVPVQFPPDFDEVSFAQAALMKFDPTLSADEAKAIAKETLRQVYQKQYRPIQPTRSFKATKGNTNVYELSTPHAKWLVLNVPASQLPAATWTHIRDEQPLKGDASTSEDDGYMVSAFEHSWADKQTFAYNCHAFTFGDFVGLQPNDWLNGEVTEVAFGTNPVRILIDAYFGDPVAEFSSLSPTDFGIFHGNSRLRSGDVLLLEKIAEDGEVEYIHSGKLVRARDKWWLMNKLGQGPLVCVPIETTLESYKGMFDGVSVYRFSPPKG